MSGNGQLNNLSGLSFSLLILLIVFSHLDCVNGKVFKGIPGEQLSSKGYNLQENGKISRQAFSGVKSTSDYVNSTLRVLVVFATFIAFILQPILELALSTASSSNVFQAFAKSFNEHERRLSVLSESDFYNNSVFGARGILDKDQCLELLTCYATNLGNASKRRSFISSSLNSILSYYFWPKKASKKQFDGNAKQGGGGISCSQYHCNPVSFIVRLFIYLVDWNTLLKA